MWNMREGRCKCLRSKSQNIARVVAKLVEDTFKKKKQLNLEGSVLIKRCLIALLHRYFQINIIKCNTTI